MPVPTAQAIEFLSPPLTGVLTAKGFAANSDVVVATAASVVQSPNRLCVYTASFVYPDFAAADAPYTIILYADGIPVATKFFHVKTETEETPPTNLTSLCPAHTNHVSLLLPRAVNDASIRGWADAETAGVPTTIWRRVSRFINSWFYTRTRDRSNVSEVVETDYAANGTTPLLSRFQTTADEVDTVTVGNPVAP